MKKIPAIAFTALFVFLTWACTAPESANEDTSPDSTAVADSVNEEPPPEAMRRNMFGHYLDRGVTVNDNGTDEAYVMFVKPYSGYVYLVNRSGEVVHEWKSRNEVMGAYLQDDGSIFVNAFDPDYPRFHGGGSAGRIQHISWDNKILWDFEYATREYLHHHDFAVMPNGNILAIAWEAKTPEEAVKAGRLPEFVSLAGMWPDKIVEIKPTGKYDGEIVWEWHMWDHMIQDHDQSLANYGVIKDHPELLDINAMAEEVKQIPEDSMDIYLDSLEIMKVRGDIHRNAELGSRYSDVYHVNAINYNPDLDQIVISSPEIGELFIIDHSTSTREAAGHSGGKYGKGGDFLWRWGNPANYGRGDSTARRIFYQHDVRWIEEGKEGAGHLTFYNNDIPNGPDSSHYSAIYELELSADDKGNYLMNDQGQFLPDEPYWVYMAKDTVSFWGSFISGAHRTEYGTTFINEGPKGRFFEVDRDGEILWEYLNPYKGNATQLNGDPRDAMPMFYYQFRATLVPAEHPGLEEKELAPLDPQPEIFKMPPKEPKQDSAIASR